MRNHKVNENHKTKHDALLMRFWVMDVRSEMQELPLQPPLHTGAPDSGHTKIQLPQFALEMPQVDPPGQGKHKTAQAHLQGSNSINRTTVILVLFLALWL